jgi:hypothetical protein
VRDCPAACIETCRHADGFAASAIADTGRNVIEFIPNFPAFIGRLQSDTATLRAEMMATPRYQAAMAGAATHKGSE